MNAADAPFIPRRPKDQSPLGFWVLREQGLAAVQALSAGHWTDYNLHDPGVTLLEQVCYALTGLVYRADFGVGDHLAGPDGRIDFAGHALHTAEVAFPCRPTTAEDYRRLLLDRVDGLADAVVRPHAQLPGRWQVELRLARGQGEDAQDDARASSAAREALALLRANRNLGEDFDHEVVMVQERWCELHATIEVGGPREPADILAEAYALCDRHIEAAGRFMPLDLLQQQGASLEQAFDGPPVQRGLLCQPGAADPSDPLFVADLLTALARVDGVQEVTRLALVLEDQALQAAGDAIARRGDGWALRLRVPGRDGDRRVRLVRRGQHVDPPAREVRAKYEDLQSGARAAQAEAGSTAFIGPRPAGTWRAPPLHCAVQDQLPAVYGVGPAGLEPRASTRDKALAWQLKAYLALFDQVMAHSAAQLAHLRELFAVDTPARQTYWWQMLDEDAVPGIRARLYTAAPQEIERRVYRPHDDFVERKGRLMDYLLSLHGESYAQNSLRQFAAGYTPTELRSVLFENKARVLRDIVRFSRDRAAAFDDARPAWDQADNASGLQRRVGLLLGLAQVHTRSLSAAFSRRGRELVPPQQWDQHARKVPARHASQPAGLRRIAVEPMDLGDAAQADADLSRMPPLAHSHLSEALARCAARADRYWAHGHADGRQSLHAGPDEEGAFWALGDFDSQQDAARAAATLRNLMLRANEEAEGLFVVEHGLLEAVGTSAAHQRLRQQLGPIPPSARAQLSVVFPAWTLRGGDRNFRAFAQETVQLNTPAHLQAQCLWLEFGEMRAFEHQLRKWMDARLAWCSGLDDETARMRMNHAASELLRGLLAPAGEAR